MRLWTTDLSYTDFFNRLRRSANFACSRILGTPHSPGPAPMSVLGQSDRGKALFRKAVASKRYPPACCASGEGTLYFAEALSDYVGDRVKGWWRACTGSITGPIIIRAYRVGVLGSRAAVEE